ncbi:MAG TPA: hypothetical protein VGE35_03900 [Candidatus Paceibacterota bacterium]
MKRNTYIIGGAILVLAAAFSAYSLMREPDVAAPVAANTDGAKFSGKITAVETGCYYDATCSVTIGGKKVIVTTGGRGPWQEKPVGRILGADSIGDLESRIGDRANVYATTTETGDYTLYGDTNFYIEVEK